MNVCNPWSSYATTTKQQIEIVYGGTEELLVCVQLPTNRLVGNLLPEATTEITGG